MSLWLIERPFKPPLRSCIIEFILGSRRLGVKRKIAPDTTGDPCVREVKFTLSQLVKMLKECDEEKKLVGITKIAENEYYKHCLVVNNVSAQSVFRGRDNLIIIGSGTVQTNVKYGTGQYVVINVKNEFPENIKGLLTIDVRGMNIAHSDADATSMNIIISDYLNVSYSHPSLENNEGVVTSPPYLNYRMSASADTAEGQRTPAHYAAGGVFANLKRIIEPGQNITFYVQYFLTFHSAGNHTVDIRTAVDAILFPMKEY